MTTIVLVETETGTMTRYECGGETARATHRCWLGEKVSIAPAVVELFRLDPPDEFSLTPPPRPTNPTSSAGRGGAGGEGDAPWILEARAA